MMNGFGADWGWIFWLLFFTIVIGVFIMIANKTRNDSHPHSSSEDSLQILRRRYASGEINREEFKQMKTDLENKPTQDKV